MPGRSLGRIPEEKLFSKREKSSRVAALEESGAATWVCDALNRGQKSLGDAWKESREDSGGESVLQKRRVTGGVSGAWWRIKFPPKEINNLR